MSEAIQIAGALAILVAYALAQFKVLDQRAYSYLLLNLAGAVVLAVIAWVERLWGFFLLETAWSLIAAAGLYGRLRTKP
jgi:fluoride ion exporter CrcB/FEX